MDRGYLLWEAVRTNDAETLNLILNHSSERTESEKPTEPDGPTLDYSQDGLSALHLSILNGNFDILSILLKAGLSRQKFELQHVLSYLQLQDELFNKLQNDVRLSILCLPLVTNDSVSLRELIRTDPSFSSDDKGEAVGVACQLRRFCLLKILLDSGGSMYLDRCEAFEQFRKQSLLMYALEAPVDSNIVKLLLDKNAPLTGQDNSGNTPLHLAAKSGDVEIVKLLMNSLMAKREPVCIINTNTYSSLHIACHQGHLSVLTELLQHQCSRRCHPEGRKYLLHSAAKAGHVAIVQFLIESGENVNQLDNFANTPLSQAVVKANSLVITRMLLKAGADPNIPKPPYHSIIISAAQKGSLEMIRVLLESGAESNSVDILGYSSMSYASGRRDCPEEFIRVLSEHGANVDHRHGDGSTSLHRAVAADNLPAVRSLIQHGADVTSGNRIGKHPLHFAVSEECCCHLLENGAIIDHQDELGYTPLMSSCRHKNVVVAQFLIDRGADINIQTVNGVSPLALTIGHDLTSLVRQLVLAGVTNIEHCVFGHFKNMLELALCLEASPAICDILHATGALIRPTFCEESLDLCPQDYHNIPHCLGVYKPYVAMSLCSRSWSEFLKELRLKFDLDKYKAPLSLQGQCGRFLRHCFKHDILKIHRLPLPEMIRNGVLLLA